MARIDPPSDVGCNSDSMDVGNDIRSRIEQIKVNNLVSGVGNDSNPLDICDDISSRIEQNNLSNLATIMSRVPLRLRSR